MREKKGISIGIRVTEDQKKALDKVIDEGYFESYSAVMRYLITFHLDGIPRRRHTDEHLKENSDVPKDS